MFAFATTLLGSNPSATLGGVGSALEKATDFWGSFTGTSASVFNEAGANWVKDAKSQFDATYQTNPALALTNFSKKLSLGVAKFSLQLKNSSQSKTRNGNKKSLDYIKSQLSLVNQAKKNLKNSFSSVTRTETFSAFGLSQQYTYNVYTVSGKSAKSETVINYDQPAQKDNKNLIYLGLAVVAYFLSKKKRGRITRF